MDTSTLSYTLERVIREIADAWSCQKWDMHWIKGEIILTVNYSPKVLVDSIPVPDEAVVLSAKREQVPVILIVIAGY